MIDVKTWISEFTNKIEQAFFNRVWFIGLQGSYGRNEATETSDIDVVVILDEMRVNDLKTYRDMLDTLPNRELVCGFISGKNELLNWEPSALQIGCIRNTGNSVLRNGQIRKVESRIAERNQSAVCRANDGAKSQKRCKSTFRRNVRAAYKLGKNRYLKL